MLLFFTFILFFDFSGFLHFLPGCLLRLLLKSVGKHHKLSLVNEAENAKDITALLHPEFIQSVGV